MPNSKQELCAPCVIVTATACNYIKDAVPKKDCSSHPLELPAQCVGKVHPDGGKASAAQAPAVDAFTAQSQPADVVLRAAESRQTVQPVFSEQHATVPFNDLNQALDFETPLFKGRALVLFKNMVNTPAGVFDGKRRQMSMTIQGKFKQLVSSDSLMLGSEFQRSLKLPAGAILGRAVTWLVQKMGGGVQLRPVGDNPHILAPIIAAAQVINVSQPGQEPTDLLNVEEDMTLFDATLVGRNGRPLCPGKRRCHFSSKSNREGCVFDTEHVWTFQAYDQSMDYATFTVPVPFFKLDLVQVLDGQPLLLMLKDVSRGQAAFKLEVWHRRMLQHKANQPAAADVSS